MQLSHIPLDRLSVSTANMRAGRKDPDISDLLPSVRARGVLVPLLVRQNGTPDSFEIVAGRRRYHAAQVLAAEGAALTLLPCAVMEEVDDAGAVEASLIENLARVAPDEVTQWETFTRLVKEGRSVEEVAAVFGLTESMVRRVLALGRLHPRIRKLYADGEIDAATASFARAGSSGLRASSFASTIPMLTRAAISASLSCPSAALTRRKADLAAGGSMK